MPIPDYQGFMLPILQALRDGRTVPLREVGARVLDTLGVSAEEREQVLPSGTQTVTSNRIQWAKTYLKKAGLIDQPARGAVRITPAGLTFLASGPPRIDREVLKQFPSFVEFLTPSQPNGPVTSETAGGPRPEVDSRTPEESLETAFGQLRSALADELLERLRASSPAFFEQAVVRLLVAMGYGGSLADAGQVVGKPGDGGIDGLIKEDKLGLDAVYVQAKRWQDPVGRPQVQAFAGAMGGERARKGVLITTSTFTKDASEYVRRIEQKIVLIDGDQLAELMIDHNVGVTTAQTYAIKKVDLDFFAEDGGG